MNNKVIIASNNKNKIREIREILGDRLGAMLSMSEAGIDMDIEETGTTFEENALIKAKAIYDLLKQPVISDDSGLVVEALGGAPGVYSARYSGAATDVDLNNNTFLLSKMKNIYNRDAKFVSCVAFYYGDDKYITVFGETCGRVLGAPEGSNGFGYDPLFFSDELGKSFGIASAEEKNSVSHRAKALKNLAAAIDKKTF